MFCFYLHVVEYYDHITSIVYGACLLAASLSAQKMTWQNATRTALIGSGKLGQHDKCDGFLL